LIDAQESMQIGRSGATILSAGIIDVAASKSLAVLGSSLVSETGGVIRGAGTLNVGGLVFTNNGIIAPGASAGDTTGTLTISGNVTLSTSSVIDIEVGGTTSGEYDRLVVSGSATLDGSLRLTMVDGFIPIADQNFNVFQSGSRMGDFASVTVTNPWPGITIVPQWSGGVLNVVGQGNAYPVAADDAATTSVDRAIVIDVLVNDKDPEGGDLSVVEATQGTYGAVTINADETVTYTPSSGYIGLDSFTYTIADPAGLQATAMVTVNIASLEAIYWDGEADDNLWSNPLNWSTNNLPGPLNDVIIDVPESDITVVLGEGDHNVRSLSSSESIDIRAGSLTLNETSQLAALDLTGGAVLGSGDIELTGTSHWKEGTLGGSGMVKFGAGAVVQISELNTATAFVFAGRDIVNEGTILWTGGNIEVDADMTVTNRGLFEIQSPYPGSSNEFLVWGDRTEPSGLVTFDNAAGATLRASGNTGFGAVILNNDGALEVVGSSYLSLSTPGVHQGTGSYRVLDAEGTLQFADGTHALSGSALLGGAGDIKIAGQGQVGMGAGTSIEGANVQVGASGAPGGVLWLMPFAEVGGAKLAVLSGGSVLFDTTGSIESLYLTEGGAFIGDGDVTLTGESWWAGGVLGGAGTLTVAEGATLRRVVHPSAPEYNGDLVLSGRDIVNEGTILWTGGNIEVDADMTVANRGLFEIRVPAGGLYWFDASGTPGTVVFENVLGGILFVSESAGQLTWADIDLINGGRIDLQAYRLGVRSFDQSDGGVLQIDINSRPDSGDFGRLATLGTAQLGGTLEVVAAPGLQPVNGDRYSLIVFGALAGDFSSVTGLTLPNGSAFIPEIDEDSYDLVFSGTTEGEAEQARNEINAGLAALDLLLPEWAALFDFSTWAPGFDEFGIAGFDLDPTTPGIDLPVIPRDLAGLEYSSLDQETGGIVIGSLIERIGNLVLPNIGGSVGDLGELALALDAIDGISIDWVRGGLSGYFDSPTPGDALRARLEIPLEELNIELPFADITPILQGLADAVNLDGNLDWLANPLVNLVFGVDDFGFYLGGESGLAITFNLPEIQALNGLGSIAGAGVDLPALVQGALTIALGPGDLLGRLRLDTLSTAPSTYLLPTLEGNLGLDLNIDLSPLDLTWAGTFGYERSGRLVTPNLGALLNGTFTLPGLTLPDVNEPVSLSLVGTKGTDGWSLDLESALEQYKLHGLRLSNLDVGVDLSPTHFGGRFGADASLDLPDGAEPLNFRLDTSFDRNHISINAESQPGDRAFGTPTILEVRGLGAELNLDVSFSGGNVDGDVVVTAAGLHFSQTWRLSNSTVLLRPQGLQERSLFPTAT
jgi:hypothetical protein